MRRELGHFCQVLPTCFYYICDLEDLKDYLSWVKYELAGLDSALGYQFLENSGGGALVVHILFQKLPV